MHLEGYLRKRGAAAYNCTYSWQEGSGWTNPAQKRCMERSSVSTSSVHFHHPHLQHHPHGVPQLWHVSRWAGTELHIRHFVTYVWGTQKPYTWDLPLSKAFSSWRMRMWLTYTVQARGEDSLHINEILFFREHKNENTPWKSFLDQKVVIPRNNWLLWVPTLLRSLFVCFCCFVFF